MDVDMTNDAQKIVDQIKDLVSVVSYRECEQTSALGLLMWFFEEFTVVPVEVLRDEDTLRL